MEKKQGISGAALKWMAIICMLIDHIGATVALQIYYQAVAGGSAEAINQAYLFYYVLRCIGRFSFPVYCFLLVEGFYHTGSRGRYLRNLAVFALVSEIPFDLAFHNSLFNTDDQNVFLTLSIGLTALWLAELLWNWFCERFPGAWGSSPAAFFLLRFLIGLVPVIPAALLAEALNTDYGGWGVALIYAFYMLHDQKTLAAVTGVVIMTVMQFIEIFGFPSIIAIHCYNGTRGKQMKYFFYLFYPVHLLILYGVCKLLGYY
ncbi:MAG: conjugal transfer protein TraX [Lachnospiraceae bacterium]|nr:conjugal transfer protein TraX [Lachnospiraceae bacterium]